MKNTRNYILLYLVFCWICSTLIYAENKNLSLKQNSEVVLKIDPCESNEIVPRNFHASKLGLREIVLTWSIPYNHPERYVIERSRRPNGPFKEIKRISPSKATYKDKGKSKQRLKDNQTFYYRMYAIGDENQETERTQIIKGITAPKPIPPKNLEAVANRSRGILLIWEPSVLDEELIYLVERRDALRLSSYRRIAEVDGKTFFQDSYKGQFPILDSTEYLYRIRTMNKVKSISDPTDPVLIKSFPPPDPVKHIQAVSNEIRCVPLKWASSQEENIELYLISRSLSEKGPFSKIAKVSGRETVYYLDGNKNPGNLLDNTTYYYQINSVNKEGSISKPSEIIKAFTRLKPVEVKNIVASMDQVRQISLKWDSSTDLKVIGYYIFRASDKLEFKKLATLKGINNTFYQDKGGKSQKKKVLGGLNDGHEYQYKIFAFNEANASSKDAKIIKATTKSLPSSPKDLEVKFDEKSGKVELIWGVIPEIKQYVIEVAKGKRDGKFHKKGIVLVKEQKEMIIFEDTDPVLKKASFYRVKSIDVYGRESEWSLPISLNI